MGTWEGAGQRVLHQVQGWAWACGSAGPRVTAGATSAPALCWGRPSLTPTQCPEPTHPGKEVRPEPPSRPGPSRLQVRAEDLPPLLGNLFILCQVGQQAGQVGAHGIASLAPLGFPSLGAELADLAWSSSITASMPSITCGYSIRGAAR